jgi:hypothetical protein
MFEQLARPGVPDSMLGVPGAGRWIVELVEEVADVTPRQFGHSLWQH